MTKKQSLFLWLSLLIALVDGLFIGGNFLFSRQALEEDFSQQAHILASSIRSAQKAAEANLLLIASVFANDAEVQKLFFAAKRAVEEEGGGAGGSKSAAIRQALYALVEPRWRDAMEHLGARQLHFHLGPGSLSFLRVHRPEKFGDRMDDVRFTIVDTNAERKSRSGFETGRVYAGIRGVVPVSIRDPASGETLHLGALEAGISYKNLVRAFEEATGASATILLTQAHVKSAMWSDFVDRRFKDQMTPCGCVIEASSSPLPIEILKQSARGEKGRFIKTGESQFIDTDHGHYVATLFPLRDYLGGRDPTRADVGAIVIWRDIGTRMNAFQRSQLFNLGYGVLAYLFVELLLLFGFHRASAELEAQVAVAAAALNESEGRLRTLINASPDIICFKDGEGRWLEANEADLKLFNLTDVDYRGQTDSQLAAHTAERYREAFLACEASDDLAWQSIEPSQGEEMIPVADGGVKIYDVIKVPVFAADGGRKGLIVLGRDVSDHKQAAQALQHSMERYRSVLETARDGFWVVDTAGRILEVNDAYCRLSQYSRDELLEMTLYDLAVVNSRQEMARHIESILEKGGDLFETSHRTKGGDSWPVEVSVSYSNVEGGRFFVFIRDIRNRKFTEQMARFRERLATMVYRSGVEALMQEALDTAEAMTESCIGFFHFVDEDQEGILLQVWSSRTLREMCFAQGNNRHYPISQAGVWVDCIHCREPVIHNDYASLPHKKGLPEGHAPLIRELTVPVMRDNRIVAVMGVGNKARDYNQKDINAVNALADVAFDFVQRKQAEQRIEYMAYFDTLTGLPNRELLSDRLNQAMAHHRRTRKLIAVCYMDLDGFKPINDQYGRDGGDALLVALAQRLSGLLREGDTLARLSGDDFALLLTDLTTAHEGEQIVRRLLEQVAIPFDIQGADITLSGSMGMTLFPTDDVNADTLLRHADQSMYQAKAVGKGGYMLYDTVQDQQLRVHRQTLNEFGQALENHEFVLHYQPRIELSSGRLVGVEALVRWQHPEQGMLMPIRFLPYIEGAPEEIALGEWVVKTALRQLMAWQGRGLTIPISVNISPKHIQQHGFAEFLAEALADYPAGTAGKLELEILETSAIGDIVQVAEVMNACTRLGVSFSLDDFGTGYSSLTYFHRLPIEILKIDQNFVRNMMDDVGELDIVEGVIRLAQTLRRPVVAEGVESVELGLLLLNLGCRYAQGYGIARPMPAEALPEWLQAWQQETVWQRLQQQSLEDIDDVELKVAIFSHSHWIERLKAHIVNGGEGEMPPQDERQCQLGRWYNGMGRSRYGNRPIYAFIPPKHNRVHELAESLLRWSKAGEQAKVEAGLEELQAVSVELIEMLRRLP